MNALSLILGIVGAVSALRVPGPLSPRNASYLIEARLDPPARELRGVSTLTWRNDASGPAESLVFHLYLNAFKNDQSAFFQESERTRGPRIEHGRCGSIDVAEVRILRSGESGPGKRIALEVPPSGDQTLATLRLDRPVLAGETVQIALHFSAHLPSIVARAGIEDGFFAVAQWFPKIGVFSCDPHCAWHAGVYHANSEFFADFGSYEVSLDVPRELVLGATGVLVDERLEGARRIARFRADDVHDFVWTADARFAAHEELVDDGFGLPPVRVLILSPPSLRAHVARHLAVARAGLAEMGKRLGPYPYAALTIVQIPPAAKRAGGMEYPTLFFTSDEPVLASVLAPELVTAHELAHQWFQGILASDEAEEPWLDEGLAEFATGWILARLEPPLAHLYRTLGHELSYVGLEQSLLLTESADPVARAAHAFRDATSYAETVYRKPSLLLQTLSARMGDAQVTRMLRAYYEQHRFAHPRGADLVAAFADAPPPLRALLLSVLHGPGRLDYAVTAARSDPERAPGKTHRNEVVIERLGQQRVPVTVEARFADGSTREVSFPEDEHAAAWQRVRLDGPSPLVEARLHPRGETPLDTLRWNDGLRARPDTRPRRTIGDSLRALAALALAWLGR